MRLRYYYRRMAKLFANSGDPDQTPHSVASDLGLHCLTITLLRVSGIQWIKRQFIIRWFTIQDSLKVVTKSVVSKQKCIDNIEI